MWTNHDTLNLVWAGPRMLKLVQVGPRLLKFVRAVRCLLTLLQAVRLIIGGRSSGPALVRDDRGRGRYEHTCVGSLVRCGRGAGQG